MPPTQLRHFLAVVFFAAMQVLNRLRGATILQERPGTGCAAWAGIVSHGRFEKGE
jgi:hypothetical protein